MNCCKLHHWIMYVYILQIEWTFNGEDRVGRPFEHKEFIFYYLYFYWLNPLGRKSNNGSQPEPFNSRKSINVKVIHIFIIDAAATTITTMIAPKKRRNKLHLKSSNCKFHKMHIAKTQRRSASRVVDKAVAILFQWRMNLSILRFIRGKALCMYWSCHGFHFYLLFIWLIKRRRRRKLHSDTLRENEEEEVHVESYFRKQTYEIKHFSTVSPFHSLGIRVSVCVRVWFLYIYVHVHNEYTFPLYLLVPKLFRLLFGVYISHWANFSAVPCTFSAFGEWVMLTSRRSQNT